MKYEPKGTAKDRILSLINPWMDTLGLGLWDIDVELAEPENLGDASEGYPATAECTASWEYERATIRFEEAYVDECNEQELERLIVHELMHIMLSEMRTLAKHKAEEHTALKLSRAFLRLAEPLPNPPESES